MNKKLEPEKIKHILREQLGKRIPDRVWKKLDEEFNLSWEITEEDIPEILAKAEELLAATEQKEEAGCSREEKAFHKASIAAISESQTLSRAYRDYVSAARKLILGTSEPLKTVEIEPWIRAEKEKELNERVMDFLYFIDLGEDKKKKKEKRREYVQVCPVTQGGKLDSLRRASELLAKEIFHNKKPYSLAQCTNHLLSGSTPIIAPLTVEITDPTGEISVMANFHWVPTSLFTWAARKARRELSSTPGRVLKSRAKPAPKTKRAQAFLEQHEGRSREENRREFNLVFGNTYACNPSLYRPTYPKEPRNANPKRLLAALQNDEDYFRAEFEEIKNEIAPELRFIGE